LFIEALEARQQMAFLDKDLPFGCPRTFQNILFTSKQKLILMLWEEGSTQTDPITVPNNLD
jgi:hypothetical protein